MLVQLLEDIRLELAVLSHRLDQLLALVMRSGLHQVGDLRGVQVGQLAVGEAQTRGGDMTDERLQVGPVEKRPIDHHALEGTRQQTSQLRAARVIDTDHSPPAIDALELDLVRGDEARRIGLDVDQLASEHILAQ